MPDINPAAIKARNTDAGNLFLAFRAMALARKHADGIATPNARREPASPAPEPHLPPIIYSPGTHPWEPHLPPIIQSPVVLGDNGSPVGMQPRPGLLKTGGDQTIRERHEARMAELAQRRAHMVEQRRQALMQALGRTNNVGNYGFGMPADRGAPLPSQGLLGTY